MSDVAFDKVVIGAGLAGLCCAGELVRHGERPLLISETAEVGAVFAVKSMGEGSRCFVQNNLWQLGWGGGWWYPLARALNVPLRLYPGVGFATRVRGSDRVVDIPLCASPAAFSEVLFEAFPVPPGASRNDLERVLGRGMAIPYEQLLRMQQVPLVEWLRDEGADDVTTALLLSFCGFPHDLGLMQAAERLSVFGGIGVLRLMMCGEGVLPIVYPSPREGLCMGLADAIERGGGTVWRGRRAHRVRIEHGAAVGVELADGTFVEASDVAVACGNGRIAALFDVLPVEAEAALGQSAGVEVADFNAFYLVDRPLVARDRTAEVVLDPGTGEIYHWSWVLSGAAPWTAQPGHQIIAAHAGLAPDVVEAEGGRDAVYERMRARSAELIPGFEEAVVDSTRFSSRHGWWSPITVGPRLPRQCESVAGLWFVGDGSEPCRGMWSEAAASCGVLGARAMAGRDDASAYTY